MTRNAQIAAFIRASLADGTTREALEDAMVCMCLAKSHAQARRAITIATKEPKRPTGRTLHPERHHERTRQKSS